MRALSTRFSQSPPSAKGSRQERLLLTPCRKHAPPMPTLPPRALLLRRRRWKGGVARMASSPDTVGEEREHWPQGSPAPPSAVLRLTRRNKLRPVVLRTPSDSGERIHMRTALASTSCGAKIHLEALETAAMTSPPWPPPVRRGLLAGGAHGRNCPLPLGEVGLVGNAVPVAEARSLLRASARQPPEPQLAPPVSGHQSPQLTARRVGPSKTALASTRSLRRPHRAAGLPELAARPVAQAVEAAGRRFRVRPKLEPTLPLTPWLSLKRGSSEQ
jgi:hypothetical protein